MVITTESLGWVVGIAGTLVGMGIALFNAKRSAKADIAEQVSFKTELRKDMEFLKENAKETKKEVKSISSTMNTNFGELSERLTRVEELAKQAKNDAEFAISRVEQVQTQKNLSA